MFKIINNNNLNSNLKPLSSSVYKMLLSDIKRLILTVVSPQYIVSLSPSKCSLEGVQDGKEGGREEKRT